MVGNLIKGVQSMHVLGDIKHYAVNNQENGRHALSSNISDRAMREMDLLAFQTGIEIGALMCACNRIIEIYAQHRWTLAPGSYALLAGSGSQTSPLKQEHFAEVAYVQLSPSALLPFAQPL